MQNDSHITVADGGCTYRSGKTYTYNVGLSCAFRQWRAKSHCRHLHGYALQVELSFESIRLDDRNWVQDFGDLKDVKEWLTTTFDHKLVVAKDDPLVSTFRELAIADAAEITVLDAVGCEAFARIIFDAVRYHAGYKHLSLVTVREHEANWASYGLSSLSSQMLGGTS